MLEESRPVTGAFSGRKQEAGMIQKDGLVRIRQTGGDFEARISDLYFAYGSNMNLEQIQARCSRPKLVSPARLDGHRLAFYGYTETWDGAYETAVPMPGCEVWGVLYSLSALDWERLDLWQDARMDGGGMYFHFPVAVTDPQGNEYRARMYKKDVQGEPRLPSREYLEFILSGAQQHGLPGYYTRKLEKLATIKASYPVPVRADTNLGASAGIFCETCKTGV
jgi:gamma-glutamylcyclotransferase